MKTLDEVIKAMEDCAIGEKGCRGCAYEDIHLSAAGIGQSCVEAMIGDALWYLKNYRSDMQMYAANQKHWEDELHQKIKDFGDAKERYIARLKELDIGTLNEPLTWDELKAMEGKPVWIKLLGKGKWKKWKGWDVIGGFDDDDFGFAMCTVRGDYYYLADLGKTWQAYRKES